MIAAYRELQKLVVKLWTHAEHNGISITDGERRRERYIKQIVPRACLSVTETKTSIKFSLFGSCLLPLLTTCPISHALEGKNGLFVGHLQFAFVFVNQTCSLPF